jgi:hypothetical protein
VIFPSAEQDTVSARMVVVELAHVYPSGDRVLNGCEPPCWERVV